MEDVVILVAYHEKPSVLELLKHHLERFRRFNPGVAIVPVTHSKLDRHPAWDYGNMWHFCDNIYYRWFLSESRVLSRRYIWFDYDTWCNENVHEFFQQVWDAPLACAKHFAHKEYPTWMWFHRTDLLPCGEQYRNQEELHGVAPICGVMLSQDVFAMLVEEQVNHADTWRHVFCELRLGTLLRKCGVAIRKNENAIGISATRRAKAFQLVSQGVRTIVHPVKFKLQGEAHA